MVKITDMIEIHDGVALMIGRHDSARGANLDAVGGMYAYFMGKFAPEHCRIDPPEHIYHSPISRARNTAKMHRIAQGVTTGRFPDISYDDRLHEQACTEDRIQAAKDAIKEAERYGYKTIELITHSNEPLTIAAALGGGVRGSLDYGGMVILLANSWEDMLDSSKIKTTIMLPSSHQLAREVLGDTQADILDFLVKRQDKDISVLEANPEIRAILEKARNEWKPVDPEKPYPDEQDLINALVKAKQEETAEWAIKALKGEDVDSVVRPDEFLEIIDAYKFWTQNMLLAVGIEPLSQGDNLQSELMEKLNPLKNKARGFIDSYLATEEGDELHPIFNAYSEKLEDGRFTARKGEVQSRSGTVGLTVPGYTDVMEPQKLSPAPKEKTEDITSHDEGDHPLLNALLAARMRAEARKKATMQQEENQKQDKGGNSGSSAADIAINNNKNDGR